MPKRSGMVKWSEMGTTQGVLSGGGEGRGGGPGCGGGLMETMRALRRELSAAMTT